MPSHVVIGGGITGLATCWYLVKAGHRPVLIEKERRLGGVIRTDDVEGCLLEGGPDSFLASKPAAMELIRDLGLEDEVIGSNDRQRVTYIVKDRRLVPMPDGLMLMVPTNLPAMAKSPLFSWGTKLKMGLEYFRRPAANAPERSVAQDHFHCAAPSASSTWCACPATSCRARSWLSIDSPIAPEQISSTSTDSQRENSEPIRPRHTTPA